MTIKRTKRSTQKQFLKDNPNLNILDLGCAIDSRWNEANHFADIFDFNEYFKNKNLKFTKIERNKKLPFEDKQFDYVILSHVLEHVGDPIEFIKEVQRIGKAGYIELPTRFNDSIVIGNEGEFGHKWWFEFDDDKYELLFSERINPIQKFISVGTVFKLMEIFKDSFIIQLHWQENISIKKIDNKILDKKISFFSLIKKFYSKKIRSLILKSKNQ